MCCYRKGDTPSIRRLLRSCRCSTTKEVHAMPTTQRLSGLLVATMFIVLLALMATLGVRSADAQGPPVQAQGPPIGGCPASYEPGLVPVEAVLAGAGLEEPEA